MVTIVVIMVMMMMMMMMMTMMTTTTKGGMIIKPLWHYTYYNCIIFHQLKCIMNLLALYLLSFMIVGLLQFQLSLHMEMIDLIVIIITET